MTLRPDEANVATGRGETRRPSKRIDQHTLSRSCILELEHGQVGRLQATMLLACHCRANQHRHMCDWRKMRHSSMATGNPDSPPSTSMALWLTFGSLAVPESFFLTGASLPLLWKNCNKFCSRCRLPPSGGVPP